MTDRCSVEVRSHPSVENYFVQEKPKIVENNKIFDESRFSENSRIQKY